MPGNKNRQPIQRPPGQGLSKKAVARRRKELASRNQMPKQRQQQQRNRNGKLNGNPPVALNTVNRFNDGGTRRFNGQDYVIAAELPTGVKAGDVIVQSTITSSTGVRLDKEAKLFQRWTPKRMTFEFCATGATTTPGMVAAAIVRDPIDRPPLDPVERLSWICGQQGAVQFKDWGAANVSFSSNEKYYTTMTGEIRLWSPGTLYVIAMSDAGAQPVSMIVNVKYDIDFHDPTVTSGADTSGPQIYTLEHNLYVKPVYKIQSVGANEDIHFAYEVQSPAQSDPASWPFTAFNIDGTSLSGLADGQVLQFSVPWNALAHFADAEDTILAESLYAVVKRNADVFNGSAQSQTLSQANVLMPAMKVGLTILPAGTIGTGTGRWHHFTGVSYLPAGTIVTVVRDNMIQVDETVDIFSKGRVVKHKTGKKIWTELDVDAYAPNFTQADLNKMPIVRMVPANLGAGLPVTVVGTNGTLPVMGTMQVENTSILGVPKPFVIAGLAGGNGDPIVITGGSGGGSDITINGQPPAYKPVYENGVLKGHMLMVGECGFASPLSAQYGLTASTTADVNGYTNTVGVQDVNISMINEQALTGNEVPVTLGSNTVSVDLFEINGVQVTAPIAVDVSRLGGGELRKVVFDDATVAPVSVITQPSVATVLHSSGTPYTNPITATDGTLQTTTSSGPSGTIDVNVTKFAGLTPCFINTDKGQVLPTMPFYPVDTSAGGILKKANTVGYDTFGMPRIETVGSSMDGNSQFNPIVIQNQMREVPVNITSVGDTDLLDVAGAGNHLGALPVCITTGQVGVDPNRFAIDQIATLKNAGVDGATVLRVSTSTATAEEDESKTTAKCCKLRPWRRMSDLYESNFS